MPKVWGIGHWRYSVRPRVAYSPNKRWPWPDSWSNFRRHTPCSFLLCFDRNWSHYRDCPNERINFKWYISRNNNFLSPLVPFIASSLKEVKSINRIIIQINIHISTWMLVLWLDLALQCCWIFEDKDLHYQIFTGILSFDA